MSDKLGGLYNRQGKKKSMKYMEAANAKRAIRIYEIHLGIASNFVAYRNSPGTVRGASTMGGLDKTRAEDESPNRHGRSPG